MPHIRYKAIITGQTRIDILDLYHMYVLLAVICNCFITSWLLHVSNGLHVRICSVAERRGGQWILPIYEQAWSVHLVSDEG